MSGIFGKQGGAHISSKPNPNIKEGLDFSHLESKEAFREFYKKLGENHSQKQQIYKNEKMDIFLPYLEDPVIEFGCHIGFNLVQFIKEGCKDITGVDCSSTLIEEAQKKCGSSPKITLIESFIEDLPEDKKYKTIVMTDVLEHVIDVYPIIKKAKSLLDKDGYILYVSPPERVGSSAHVRGITKEEITKWLNKHKLQIFKWLPSHGSEIRLIAEHEK